MKVRNLSFLTHFFRRSYLKNSLVHFFTSNLSFFQKFWSQSLGTLFSTVRLSWEALYNFKWRTRRGLSFGTFASFVSKLKTCENHSNMKGSNLKIQLARVFLTNWVANWENESKKLHFFCWEGQLLFATFFASPFWTEHFHHLASHGSSFPDKLSG